MVFFCWFIVGSLFSFVVWTKCNIPHDCLRFRLSENACHLADSDSIFWGG